MTSHIQFSPSFINCVYSQGEIFNSFLSLKEVHRMFLCFEKCVLPFNIKNGFFLLLGVLLRFCLFACLFSPKERSTTSLRSLEILFLTSSEETPPLLMKEEVEMPTVDADSEAPTTCCKSCCLKGIMCSLNYYMVKEI